MKTIKLEVKRVVNDRGQLVLESFYLNGKFHNEHGPAIRRWNDRGELVLESFYLNDQCHNEHGPAIRRWNDRGELVFESFYLNGRKVDFLPMNKSCEGKVVEIEGRKYRLTSI